MTRELPKNFVSKDYEEKIYSLWEKAGVFTPIIDKKKKPFTIILPLPNASDPMHVGHAMFVIEDILTRYHIMRGDPTLWLPGADHAGIETQFVFEKQLAKEGKSRFDFDRETLFGMLKKFVEKNRLINKDQLKKLGFALDWSSYHYSMEPEMVERVLETFGKLHKDGLIYRGERVVQYCTKCGTAFSDLEINYVERKDKLYYLKYGPFILATTRPETKFGDTAVAFHPGDKRYEKYLGQEIEIQGVNGSFKVKAVADEAIDPEFGTGIEKVTPGHDAMDFEIGQRHGLSIKSVIGFDGRMTELAGRFAGMKVNEAREAVFRAMEEMGLIDHVDESYVHTVATCYRCGTVIEPLVFPQWFVKTKPLAEPAIKAVKNGETKIFPQKRFEKMYFDWMENIKDWNISRQIVWGPQIPVWYCLDCNDSIKINFLDNSKRRISGFYKDLKQKYSFQEMSSRLQSLLASKDAKYQLFSGKCEKCHGQNVLQETDTFDTWFLSSQWPVNTLKSNPGDLEYFYPTSVLDTLWDILFFWAGRMMMMGLYLTGKVPFRVIHLHARVVDKHGKKMSKSKGNVIDPLVLVNQYGADALRLALVLGVGPASDVSLSDEKVRGMRNFSTKLWNIGIFILIGTKGQEPPVFSARGGPAFGGDKKMLGLAKEDLDIVASLKKVIEQTTLNIESFRFGQAAEDLYQFIWHEFADVYVEKSKERIKSGDTAVLAVLGYVFSSCLKLLHPFMPFVTEAIWQEMFAKDNSLLIKESWPFSD